MYVVVLIVNGTLQDTANRTNPHDALDLAKEWAYKYRDKEVEGIVAIDEQIRGKDKNRRFAELNFKDPDNIQFKLRDKGENPLLSSRIPPAFKFLMITAVEFALKEVKEYLKEDKSRRY